jgi:hypothetical protein
LILTALVAASLIFHVAILWGSREEIAAGYGDFIIFYTGAQIINDGKAKELFKVETQNAYQAKFDVPQLEWPLPFNHAPYELFLFLPLAHLSYPVAHAIWSGVNLLLLVIMLQWLLPYVHSLRSVFIGASLFSWFPTMEALRLGQDSILSTVLLLAVFIALKQRRDGWGGVFGSWALQATACTTSGRRLSRCTTLEEFSNVRRHRRNTHHYLACNGWMAGRV